LGGIIIKKDKNKHKESSHEGMTVVWGYPYEKQVSTVFGECEDANSISVDNIALKFSGRIINVTVNLSRVCAGRKITMGVILQENLEDELKTVGYNVWEGSVPGVLGTCIEIFSVSDFIFNLPEWDLCDERQFKVSVVAHYSSF